MTETLPEILEGEIVDAPTGLPTNQQRAAFLDAHGANRQEIASAVGVTLKTVSVWRADRKYQKFRDAVMAKELERVEPLFAQARIKSLEAYMEALEEAREMLKAVKDDGMPDRSTRTRAVELLLHLVDVGLRSVEGDGERATATSNVAVIVVPDGR